MPFTPHGLTKVIFHFHHMEITNLLHITSPCSHHTEYRTPLFTPHGIQNSTVYTTWNTELHCLHHMEYRTQLFTLHRIQKLICLHRTEYNCAIYTALLNRSDLPYRPHGNNKNFCISLHGLPKYTSAYSLHGLTKLFCLQFNNFSIAWVNPTSPFTPHSVELNCL